MKISLVQMVLFTVFVGVSWANDLSAQELLNRRLSLQLKEEKIKAVLREIEKATDVRFSYSPQVIQSGRLVSISVKHATLGEVLDRLLKPLQIRYDISGRQIILSLPQLPAPQSGAVEVPGLEESNDRTLKGKVIDEKGDGLPGVNIIVKNTQLGTVTNSSGEFSLNVAENDPVLVFSYVGYISLEQSAGNRNYFTVTLKEDNKTLDEVVVMGYGSQKKATVTGAISTLSGNALVNSPSTNLSGSLAGRLPGLTVVSSSGEPGRDNALLRIRGANTLGDNSPLVVVDGIQNRDLFRLNPADIESITVLKDASAAIYGAQAANGVILVTTKRGNSGKPELTVNFNQGISKPTIIPEMADAATYATMINEIDAYRNNALTYTPAAIEKYRDGSDPYLYPNTNWFKEVFKPSSLQSQTNISLKGGTETMRYFVSAGYVAQDGIYKNSATKYGQGDIRSNLDATVSKNIQVSLDIVGRQENRDFPVYTTNQIFSSLINGGSGSGGRPTELASYPGDKPNSGFINGLNPVVMGTQIPGYDKGKNYSFLSNARVVINVAEVKGMSVTANASVDKGVAFQKRWIKPFTLYSWDKKTLDQNNEPVTIPGKFGPSPDPQLTQSTSETQRILLNTLVNYETSILQRHNLKLMAGAERITGNAMNFFAFRRGFISTAIDELFAGSEQQRNNGGTSSYSPRLNYFGRVNYDYDRKYMVEMVWRFDGSYIFPKQGRFGFFPGVSAGWKVSEEAFWKDNVAFVTDFKIRGSWGKTGNDRIAPFQYLSSYGFNSAPYVFDEDEEVKSLNELRIANPNITWEVARQSNVGFDMKLYRNRISITAEYFSNLRSNILWYRNASVPASTGLSLPVENIGKVRNSGFDFQVVFQNRVNDFFYSIGVNGSTAKNRIEFWDETPGVPEYQRSTGKPMNTSLYYNAIGIFRDQAAVDNYPHWSGARPGDIIFEDINKDGKIDGLDRVRFKKNSLPTFTGGINLDFEYKNFYTSFLWQASTGAVLSANIGSGKIGNFLAKDADGRWTADNPDAVKPRTWNANGEYWTTDINNTYWLINNDYLRLKNFQFGYNVPAAVATKLGMNNLTLYFNGLNLITLTKAKGFDPETIGNNYPLNKVYNFGIRLSFK